MGARLLKYTLEAMDDQVLPIGIWYWTDSQITLCWIRSSSQKWKCFVANRVQEIHNLSEPQQWNYCPGLENPADLLTMRKLIDTIQWWHGPKWLSLPVEHWPKQEFEETSHFKLEQEMKSVVLILEVTEPLFDLSRFSTLSRTVRVTAWVMRVFCSQQSAELTTEELKEAKGYWIKRVQLEAFHEEILALGEQKPMSTNSRLKLLSPFLDDKGYLRLGGRLHFLALPYVSKHPLILPSKGRFVELIMLDAHERLFHSGLQETLAAVREEFWVLKGRRSAQNAINKCLVCKKYRAKPTMQITAPLPFDRVCKDFAFAVTGLDFAGPLWVYDFSKKGSFKAYFVVFTCAVTRAIHVDLTSTMNAEAFILALKRFFSLYGIPHTIYSDNAKTFHKAQRELRGFGPVINSASVQDFVVKRQIKWKFIIERVAWWGGFWERMVKSVKERLKKTVGRSMLTFEELLTILYEISAILNSRPLTYLSEDTSDVEALTTGHFICGGRSTSLTRTIQGDPANAGGNHLRKRWQQRNQLVDSFWKKWSTQYLQLLRNFHTVPQEKATSIQVGEIVILQEGKLPRSFWQLARVVENFSGRDGRIRTCRIRTSTGAELRRAVQHLYRLEL